MDTRGKGGRAVRKKRETTSALTLKRISRQTYEETHKTITLKVGPGHRKRNMKKGKGLNFLHRESSSLPRSEEGGERLDGEGSVGRRSPNRKTPRKSQGSLSKRGKRGRDTVRCSPNPRGLLSLRRKKIGGEGDRRGVTEK